MNSSTFGYFRIDEVSKNETIHQAGNLVIKKSVYKISSITNNANHIVHISTQGDRVKLPEVTFVSIKDATLLSGFSETTIRNWCKKNLIEAKKPKKHGPWIINVESLNNYLYKRKDRN
ncbi:MAG: helix-turn-helix domain-containing protein [Anaerolineales bacterium]|nr:helix-turn-helix domain-containing protein [Anaerolineales bacterium]